MGFFSALVSWPILVWFLVALIVGLGVWWKWDWITLPGTTNASTASALVAATALIVTGFLTSLQLQLTRTSLESSLVYQMLKDTRTAGLDYAKGKIDEAQLFSVMQSVFIEQQIGSIGDNLWPIFNQDFCGVMQQPHMRTWWQTQTQTDKTRFTPRFVTYINDIAHPNSSNCKG